ncbi:MAG: hypothetical protein LUP96_01640 [Methylococcaceae bacterium]|nr:hypothetical protein [Methylococcaceae bacterium]
MGNILTTQAKTKRIIRHVIIMGGISLLISQKVLAAALFDHIVQPYVGTQLTYDNNLLRLPKNSLLGTVNSKGSFIEQLKAGLAINWQISQQQLKVDANINQNWFSTFNTLNYTGYNVLAQWDWRLTQKLKGELSYNNSLVLGSFQQMNALINNLRNREIYVANGAYEILPDWFLRAGFTRDSTSYPARELQINDLVENRIDFGFRYANPLENMVGFHVTLTDGKYSNRAASSILDNAYTRVDYNLEGVWNYSVKTRIRGQIGYTSQTFEHIKSRNFSDIIATGDILWQATRKSSLYLEFWRDISAADNLTASFQLSQGVRLTPAWTWSETPMIQVELPISYEQQSSLGALDFGNTSIPLQQANNSLIQLNLNYTPIPNVKMTAFALYEERRSNNPLQSYQHQSVGLTMNVSF